MLYQALQHAFSKENKWPAQFKGGPLAGYDTPAVRLWKLGLQPEVSQLVLEVTQV